MDDGTRPPAGWLEIGSDPTADVVIEGEGLSGCHARLRPLAGGAVELQDQGGFHGTYVDGIRVDRGTARPGSRVDLAGATFSVEGGRLVRRRFVRQGARLDLHRITRLVGDGTVLLDDVSLTVLPGELVAVIGASGAGKSSLVRTIVGAEPPTEGVVLVDGEDLYLHADVLGGRVGYLPQAPSLHGRLTVRSAIRHAGRLRLGMRVLDEDRIDAALERARISHRADARIDRLSGGESKRAHLAAELVGDPGLLVLDEPTSGLDALLDRDLMRSFRRIADEGIGVVVVTHALDHLEDCDRVLLLARGGLLVGDESPAATRTWLAAPTLTDCLAVVEHDPEGARQRHVARRGVVPPPTRSRRYRTPDVIRSSSMLEQSRILALRSWELLARDRRTLVSMLLQAPVIGLALLAVTEPGSFSDPEVIATVTTIVVFGIAITVLWLSMLGSAREVTKEESVRARERLLGVSPIAYLASKAATLVPIAAWQAIVIFALVCLVAGLPPDGVLLPAIPEAMVTLLLSVTAAIGLGLLVSALAPNEDRAIALVPYVLLPQFLLAGVAFEVPDALRPVQFATIAYWSIGALGATVDVCSHPFGGAASCADALGIPFRHEASSLLTRWSVLWSMTLATWGGAWMLLARGDASRRYR